MNWIQHTKELSENAREEVQVARDIVSHDGRERFHHSVNAKNSLNKLQIQKKNVYYIQNLEKNNGCYINCTSKNKEENDNKKTDFKPKTAEGKEKKGSV